MKEGFEFSAGEDYQLNTIAITIEIVPEKREEFIQAIRLLNERVKEEKGLSGTDLFQDIDNPNRFNLIQNWKTQDNLDNYTRSENFKILMGALKLLAEHSEIRYNLTAGQLGKKVVEM